MITYYIHENGRVLGGTITLPADAKVPSNAFLPNEEQETSIRRWLANNLRVYWTAQIGPHLDPSRDPPAPIVTPAPPIPPAETSPTPHPSDAAAFAFFEGLVAISDPNLSKAEKVEVHNSLKAKMAAFKSSVGV